MSNNVFQFTWDNQALSVNAIRLNDGHGVAIGTNPGCCLMPDDEIPNLISALQNYMTQRAKQITGRSR